MEIATLRNIAYVGRIESPMKKSQEEEYDGL